MAHTLAAADHTVGWVYSGQRRPCPVCGRTKDQDCKWSKNGEILFCHKPKPLEPGAVVNGWGFVKNTPDGRAGHFVRDKPRASRKPSSLRVVGKVPRQPPFSLATTIGLDEELQRRLGQNANRWSDPTRPRTVVIDYGNGLEVRRQDQPNGQKACRPWHQGRPGAGPEPWPLYWESLALQAAGQWLLEGEGEKVADLALAGGLIATTQPGHAHKAEQIRERYQRLAAAGIKGVVFLADNDEEGARRMAQAQEAAAAVGLPFLPLPAAQVWPGLPAKGSIDDAPGSLPERVQAINSAAAGAFLHQSESVFREEASPLDQLLGPAEEGRMRRPRNDKLTQAIGMILPLRYNLLTNRIERDGQPVHGDYLGGLYLELAEQHGIDVAKERAIDAAMRVARQNAYHPVRDYLNGITEQLSPEEWASIDVHCFGSEDPHGWSAVHLQRQLIAMAARALDPGCDVHTCLVLQSDGQGIGKSTFWRLLGGEWFSDSLGDLRDLKEDRLLLHSAWIHEWGEIDNVIGKRESETLKRFLSCNRDDVRRPYGRGAEQLLRSCCLVGTTNRRDFIKDPTGNRRFPIIQVQQVNLEWVQANRDRIWGSAVAAYKAGERWHYTHEEGRMVSDQAMAYAADDPLRDRIETWADDHPDADEVPAVRILWDLRQECPDYWERRADREFMRQVTLALTALNWSASSGRTRYQLPDGTRTDKVTRWKRP